MKTIVSLVTLVLACYVTQTTHAQSQKSGPGCCGDNVCQLVKTEIETKVICYGCRCEDFCIPGKSCLDRNADCGCTCQAKCGCQGKCSCGCDHAPDCKICVKHWTPGCAKLKSRKVLVKYEKTVKVPGWKWVVVKGNSADCGRGKATCGCAALTKPAPAGAMIGQSFAATDEEIKLVSASLPLAQPAGQLTKPVEQSAKPSGFKSLFGSFMK